MPERGILKGYIEKQSWDGCALRTIKLEMEKEVLVKNECFAYCNHCCCCSGRCRSCRIFSGHSLPEKHFRKITGSAEDQAAKIIDDAKKEAAASKKAALVEAKEEIHKNRHEMEREIRDRRNEMTRQERRLQQKEESLDKKMDTLEKKDEVLTKKNKELERMQEDVAQIQKRQLEQLEKISGLSVEEAKEYLIRNIETEARYDAAKLVKTIEAEAKEEADKRARMIVGMAIQKCAADHVAETTVSVVSLPSDEMKGRIIGRESQIYGR